MNKIAHITRSILFFFFYRSFIEPILNTKFKIMIIKIKKSKFSEIFEELITQERNLINFPETINALLLLSIVEY